MTALAAMHDPHATRSNAVAVGADLALAFVTVAVWAVVAAGLIGNWPPLTAFSRVIEAIGLSVASASAVGLLLAQTGVTGRYRALLAPDARQLIALLFVGACVILPLVYWGATRSARYEAAVVTRNTDEARAIRDTARDPLTRAKAGAVVFLGERMADEWTTAKRGTGPTNAARSDLRAAAELLPATLAGRPEGLHVEVVDESAISLRMPLAGATGNLLSASTSTTTTKTTSTRNQSPFLGGVVGLTGPLALPIASLLGLGGGSGVEKSVTQIVNQAASGQPPSTAEVRAAVEAADPRLQPVLGEQLLKLMEGTPRGEIDKARAEVADAIAKNSTQSIELREVMEQAARVSRGNVNCEAAVHAFNGEHTDHLFSSVGDRERATTALRRLGLPCELDFSKVGTREGR